MMWVIADHRHFPVEPHQQTLITFKYSMFSLVMISLKCWHAGKLSHQSVVRSSGSDLFIYLFFCCWVSIQSDWKFLRIQQHTQIFLFFYFSLKHNPKQKLASKERFHLQPHNKIFSPLKKILKIIKWTNLLWRHNTIRFFPTAALRAIRLTS